MFDRHGCGQDTEPRSAIQDQKANSLPKSSQLFVKLADSVGLSRYQDPAFVELKSTLSRWFPK